MSDTNYIGGIVKILETPKLKIINNNILEQNFVLNYPKFEIKITNNCQISILG